MRREQYKKYLFLAGTIALLLTLPLWLVDKGRIASVALLSPIWKSKRAPISQIKLQKLEAENHLLRIELGKLRTLVDASRTNGDQTALLAAQVIYRDPGNWMSSFWVDVGEQDNLRLGCEIVSKNSPVLSGNALIGVVDYVGKKQSRIRLITDMGLKPSVRAVRGSPQNATFVEQLDAVLLNIKGRSDLPLQEKQMTTLISYLERIKGELTQDAMAWYLAKGVIQGGGSPLWRDRTHLLRGIGFNYDFADEEGPARDLRSGKPLEYEQSLPALPLIQENDLLVTTGMDGVFPLGLRVAEVTKVYPLREGSYTYEIDAAPVVKNIDSLQTVFIIPKMSYTPEA